MSENLIFFIIPVFNIIAGTIGLLIGFGVYKPFKKDKAEMYEKKFGLFFKIGGIGMLLWGIINLLMMYS